MGINEIIMYIMMFFMLIAAVDRILSQFGGSARFLGKFGKSIEGSGGQFEEGFMAMGALGLAMVGMTALAPVLAHVLGPVIIPVYEMLGANPSMFAGTLLACDMGGFFLAKELAGGDVAAWLYSGLILGSMMGPTIVFSIPVALGIIEPSDRRYLALGVLAGIVTIPIGCIAGGLVAMYSGVQINGQPVEFTFALGDHLGFAAANMNAMIFPMIVGKLIGGVTAIGVAMMLVPKEDATATKTEAEAQS
ncbi:ethanolamine utilization protein EutH [Escherichia coli]|uniref:ethanolamine utilization protein EutH n=1 Tax=Escherichia coli TaxID=562 RepID=UPI00179F101A|nr:ethanolamine utilization protein EutH [Escherichia coli]EFG9275264.1 ethanolamine utilization protein EutH [Escherichia coli]MCZ0437825.1 ethanolamine utilization protein EutH [Escherichia coli]HBV0336790.1 ethanolamine utilization protein EutH [Escherichia coli]HCO7286091.1 ethanolamine utilization protein EutH [Escherichia coli]HCO7299784.1 ethanolamine utilization protein EutH [Escherichia coli]